MPGVHNHFSRPLSAAADLFGPQNGTKLFAEKPLMLALIYVVIALIALAWRFVFIPWDFGGCFYQVWITAIGAALAAFYPRLNGFDQGEVLGDGYRQPGLLEPFEKVEEHRA